jgi:hypothetical protein
MGWFGICSTPGICVGCGCCFVELKWNGLELGSVRVGRVGFRFRLGLFRLVELGSGRFRLGKRIELGSVRFGIGENVGLGLVRFLRVRVRVRVRLGVRFRVRLG